MNKKREVAVAVVLIMILIQTWPLGAAASLSVPELTAPSEGNLLSAPVSLETAPGQQVAGLQFELEFDPAVFDIAPAGAVRAGDATIAAKKQVAYSSLAPGKIRVLIFGLNHNLLDTGEIALIDFTLTQENARSMEPLDLSNTILSDLSGAKIRVVSRGGAVKFSEIDPLNPPSEAQAGTFPLAVTILVILLVVMTTALFLWRYGGHRKTFKPKKRG